eukprot:TRINITY_DN18671_c0_g1_i1.p1 TRINITY_DN18671_c0_g1~~TRINITY_DN18671_c0_g1_i1.p1  ORF type:complete len:111 (-),score=23.19 TRINITY_DN18671_c0_g1_i1:77-409(-)
MCIRDRLRPVAPYKPIVRDVSLPEIVDKLAILDVMNFGSGVVENYEHFNFEMTERIVDNFSKQIVADTKFMKKMFMLHRDLMKKYSDFVKAHSYEGKRTLRREFIKQMDI